MSSIKKFSRALVTGGAGFIGSHIVDQLIDEDWIDQVTVLDDLSFGHSSNLKEHALPSKKFKLVKGDINDSNLVRDILMNDGIEVIFHEASIVSVPLSIEKPELTNRVNVEGTSKLLHEASNSKTVKRFIFASSAAVYGNCQDLPLKEESATTVPISPYGKSKLAGEKLCMDSFEKTGLGVTILRYFNAYGPRSLQGGYASVVNKFMEKLAKLEAPVITGNGEATRDFVYVKDIAQANIMAASDGKSIGKIYNVASGTKITMNDLATLELEILLGKSLVMPFNYKPRAKEDIVHSYADASKIEREIGFKAKYSIEAGLNEYFHSLWNNLPISWQHPEPVIVSS